MNFLNTKFKEFERKISKLKSLKEELYSLDTEGFESEARLIRSMLNSPDKIPEIEKGIEELRLKVERRIHDISVKRTSSETSIKEGHELEVTPKKEPVLENTIIEKISNVEPMPRLRYEDFELKIEKEGDHYATRVLHSPHGEAKSVFKLPFSEEKLELLVLKIGRDLRISTRNIHSMELEAAYEFGGKLFEAVFVGEVLASLRSSLEGISEGTGLRLKLHLQEVAELADLPWEFLFDASLNRFFANSNLTPIVRYIEMPERIKPLMISLPLNILVMTSSPTDYLRLDVEREKSSLKKALEPLSREGKVSVKWLEKPASSALLHCLREGKYHIFHFIGHGGFDRKANEGVLVIEDEQGRSWNAGANRIGTLLHDHQSLRLAVLNSCEGARNSRTDPFAGVAATLIRQGIPAVVAMQFVISDEAAIIFAGEFYSALAGGFPVDAAVAEARKAVYAQPNDIEWGTPVLYLRSPDGVLFNPVP